MVQTAALFVSFLVTAVVTAVQFSHKKPRLGALLLGLSFVLFIAFYISVVPFVASALVSETSSLDVAKATASSEPTDAPTPGPCDVRSLRKVDTEPGADILAGNDPSESVQAAVTAERKCAESLPAGSEAYARHVIAEGDEYLLGGAHGPDEILKKVFFKDAVFTVQAVADDSDLSPTTRAKAQELINTANAKLQALEQ